MSELTKEQKQEINWVVRKYLPRFRDRVGFDTPFLGITGGLLGATFVALADVVFMGGALTLWTGAACMAGAGLGLGGGVKSGIYERERRLSWTNFSGQKYEANRTIHGILNLGLK